MLSMVEKITTMIHPAVQCIDLTAPDFDLRNYLEPSMFKSEEELALWLADILAKTDTSNPLTV